MADGWRQVWEDMRHALLGKAPDGEPEAEAPAKPVEQEAAKSTEHPDAAAPVVPPAPEQPPDTENGGAAQTPAPDTAQEVVLLPEGASSSAPAAEGEAVDAPPEEAHPRWQRTLGRALAAMALLAIAGWILLATGWWARLTAPEPPAEDVIATYEGGQITTAELEEHLELLLPHEGDVRPTQDEVLLLVEDIVTDRLVQRWAATREPEQEESFRHAMEHVSEEINLSSLDTQLHEEQIQVAESEIRAYYDENREQFGDMAFNEAREQIRQTLVAQREQDYVSGYLQRLKDNASIARNFELLDVPAPSEDDLRRYYEENREQYRVPPRVVVDELQIPIGEDETAARQAADDALLQLRSGAPFATVPEEIPAAQVATDIPVSKGTREAAWDEAVFVLTEGELSDVIRAGNAFYVVRVQNKEDERLQSFEEVRAQVEAAVTPEIVDEWFTANAAKTLFTLKGNSYSVGEFYREYQELPPTTQAQYSGAEGMKALAEQLIERLLLVMDANEQLLDVQNQPLNDEARLQMLRQMMHQEEVDDKIEIGDEEVQQFYDENQELMALPPQARIRYIRIGLGNSAEEAEAARQRADEAYGKLVPGLFQEGEPFAEVAQEYSEDPETAANGGEMPGWVGGGGDLFTQLEQYAFNDAVLALDVGEISRPFEYDGSLYIVQVIERAEPEKMSLEEARPTIEEILRQRKHEELLVELQQQLLEQADLEVYQDVLTDYLQQYPTPEPFFPVFEPTPTS